MMQATTEQAAKLVSPLDPWDFMRVYQLGNTYFWHSLSQTKWRVFATNTDPSCLLGPYDNLAIVRLKQRRSTAFAQWLFDSCLGFAVDQDGNTHWLVDGILTHWATCLAASVCEWHSFRPGVHARKNYATQPGRLGCMSVLGGFEWGRLPDGSLIVANEHGLVNRYHDKNGFALVKTKDNAYLPIEFVQAALASDSLGGCYLMSGQDAALFAGAVEVLWES